MGFTDNFKYNYQKKFLLSSIQEKNSSEVFKQVNKLINSNNPIFYKLILENINSIQILLENVDNPIKNIIWINSFSDPEAQIIESFLKYYFDRIDIERRVHFNYYSDEIIDCLKPFKEELDIDMSNFVYNSEFYQLLISMKKQDKTIFLKNHIAFFEHEPEKKFTYTNYTQSYLYILRDPLKIYCNLKSNKLSTQEAQNFLLNLDQKPSDEFIYKYNLKHKLEINRMSWSKNVASWDDYNVVNTHRGLILKLEDIFEEPNYYFANIISHIKQAGLDIELNYDIIEEYSKKFEKNKTEMPLCDISQKEIKPIKRDLSEKSNQYLYKLS